MTWWIVILFKPLFALFFMICLVLPLKLLFKRILPNGRTKDILFMKLGDK